MKRVSSALRTSLKMVAFQLFQDFIVKRDEGRRQWFRIFASVANLPLYRLALLGKGLYQNGGDYFVRGFHLRGSQSECDYERILAQGRNVILSMKGSVGRTQRQAHHEPQPEEPDSVSP
jgi:hypothetical protein